MRILLATGIYPPEIGGVATVIERLAKDLRARNHEVIVVTYGEVPDSEGVVRVSRRGNVLARYLRFAARVKSLLAPETLVMATDIFSVGIPVRWALRGKKNRFVLRLGGEWFWEDSVEKGRDARPLRAFWQKPPGGLRGWLVRLDYRWLLGRADRVIVTSGLLKGLLVEAFPACAAKIVVANYRPPQVVSLGARTNHDPLRLVYVGRFAKVKNLPFLGRVLKRLQDQRMAFVMTFIGDGPDFSWMRQDLRGLANVTFLGACPQDVVQRTLAESDALLLPSLSDIYPNVVLEALGLGVPAIVTTEQGLPEQTGGIMKASPLDEQAWVQAVMALADPQAYQALAATISLPEAPGIALEDALF